MERKIVTTSDGSHSLYVPALDEHYHSTHGSIQEALHVFIAMGLKEAGKERSSLDVLEIGFGTGLNALLTVRALEELSLQIQYTGLEAYPVAEDVVLALNYCDVLGEPHWNEAFTKMHALPWEESLEVTPDFFLKKCEAKLEDFAPEQTFDLIYFDAFGPRAQPELWEPQWLQKIFELTAVGGVFVTYCAKGQVRRDLQAAGYEVERLPGPPGKREMLRGIKRG